MRGSSRGSAKAVQAAFDTVLAGDPAWGTLAEELFAVTGVVDGSASLRLDLPFAERGAISLKKIGLELVVRVDGHKRTIVLPGALAGFKPTSATLDEGSLLVGFEHG